MLNLDPAKLLVILVVGFLVIGPERMPRVARQLGTVIRTAMSYREQAESQIRKAMPDLDLPRIPTNPRAAVSTFLTSLTTGGGHVSVDEPVGASGSTLGDSSEAFGAERQDIGRLDLALRSEEPSEPVNAGLFGIAEMN